MPGFSRSELRRSTADHDLSVDVFLQTSDSNGTEIAVKLDAGLASSVELDPTISSTITR